MDSLTRIPADADVLDKLLFLELKHFVADHNLNYTDKMSMAEGVEVRVPFLDLDFVAFAMSLPTHQKIRGLTGKWTLRKAIAPHVPPSVISRKKTGFGVPLRSWFGAGMPDFLRETLSASVVKRRGLFDPAGVKKLRLMNAAGLVDASYSLLAIACIELWMRTFIDGPTPALIDTPSADKPRDQ
jgi:asparagine synthase (glutamine-hydrolysing)